VGSSIRFHELKIPACKCQPEGKYAVFIFRSYALTNAAFKAILLHPDAWDVLTPEEKKDVLAKFPDETRILNAGSETARPDLASLANDDNFRYDCARYCENIELGRHDEEWLTQAWVAHEKHKRGDYDEFLREQFEEDWGTEMPVESSVKGTQSHDESKEASTVLAESLLDDAQRASTVNDNPPRLSKSPHDYSLTRLEEQNDQNSSLPPPREQSADIPTSAAQSNSKPEELVEKDRGPEVTGSRSLLNSPKSKDMV